jgi:hypothetical protein
LKEEALDCTVCRTRFGGSYGPVVRQATGWTNRLTSPREKKLMSSYPVYLLFSSNKIVAKNARKLTVTLPRHIAVNSFSVDTLWHL